MAEKTNKRGRKPKVDKALSRLADIESWAAQNMSDKDIFPQLGISEDTWYRYKNKHKKIKDALEKGRLLYIQNNLKDYEDALKKKAIGNYEIKEAKRIYDSKGKVIRTEVTTKQIPPDSKALIFALQSLAPEKYVSKNNTNLTGNLPVEVHIYDDYGD